MIEFTVPIEWALLNAWSFETAFTMSWAWSNVPRTAMLKMFGSESEYICARWKALMRPCGESMKTRIPFLPRMAYSAADPVSPEVAPRMFSSRPSRARRCSKSAPRYCIAMSLKARVGPFESSRSPSPSPSQRTGVIASVSSPSRALQYVSFV